MPFMVLIRHGENDYTKRGRMAGRLAGVHLNDRGRQQAQELAEALRGAPIKAVYSSPLERAIETARPIAKVLHVPLRRAAGLMETDVGDWEGHSIRRLSLTRNWRVFQQNPSRARHPGGESLMEAQARVVSTLDAICSRHKKGDVIACVFHADPIKMAVAHYVGLPLDHLQRLACDTASLTLLAVSSTTARLMWLNQKPPFNFGRTQSKR